MKKTLILFCLSALIGAFGTACNDGQGPGQQQVTDVPSTEYPSPQMITDEYGSPVASYSWVNLYYGELDGIATKKLLVIDSDEELKKYVEGDYPAVDFSKKTLVLAYGHGSGVDAIVECKFRQVSEQSYVMTVYQTALGILAIIEWEFAIIVDKLPAESKIELITKNVN